MGKAKWRALAAALVLVGAWFGLDLSGALGGAGASAVETRAERSTPPRADEPAGTTPVPQAGEPGAVARIRAAFEAGTGGFWATLEAPVERTLSDDTQGSRHQRFVLRLAPDLTLLVAHNVDLAARVPVKAGDVVRLRGEYEWNHKGGVLHWTHHDPSGRPGGWIELAGKRYE